MWTIEIVHLVEDQVKDKGNVKELKPPLRSEGYMEQNNSRPYIICALLFYSVILIIEGGFF